MVEQTSQTPEAEPVLGADGWVIGVAVEGMANLDYETRVDADEASEGAS